MPATADNTPLAADAQTAFSGFANAGNVRAVISSQDAPVI